MKKILLIALLLNIVSYAYSQTEPSITDNYDKKVIENSKLKKELEAEKLKNGNCENVKIKLKKQIAFFSKESNILKEEISKLNKSKIKKDRDYLLTKVDSLNDEIIKQKSIIEEKELQYKNEKVQAKEDGKKEALASIVNTYKNIEFDDLIKTNTKSAVSRDIQLVGDNTEIKQVLEDLQIYFNVKELLLEKFDAIKIKNAEMQLSKIKCKSKLLATLKTDVRYYKDFNNDLKSTINKLVDLDKLTSAGGNSDIQKMKFNDIVVIVSGYMYDYYDYVNYPYLSDIVLEIIKIKRGDADKDISYLLTEL